MKSFITRLASAIVATSILVALYYFLGPQGFKVLVSFGAIVSAYELGRIFFSDQKNFWRHFFVVTCIAQFFIFSYWPLVSEITFGVTFVGFCFLALILNSTWEKIEDIQNYLLKSVLGWIYLGLLPSFAWRILDLKDGLWWFVSLLAVVFAGDIGAYLLGVLFGKTKILPRISPKKSLQGSIGGILGSLFAMSVCVYASPYTEWYFFLPLAALTGIFAQAGDFFESLLKRIASVKDSGTIMPGHGGILDRIDGVLFASPIFFAAAFYFGFYF